MNSIIDNSNVIHVSYLNGHKRYTFTNSTNGIRFSEPEEIPRVNLSELVSSLREQGGRENATAEKFKIKQNQNGYFHQSFYTQFSDKLSWMSDSLDL